MRVLLIAVGADAPSTLADLWLLPADIPELVRLLSQHCEVLEGMCDAMFATGWTYVWAVKDGRFELWAHDGRVLEGDGTRILLRREKRAIAREDITAVAAWVSECWSCRQVRLLLRDGTHLTVAEQTHFVPSSNYMYDGLNLLVDSAWTIELAYPLARVLGVPYKDQTR
ncbi:MAG: hypothetical protein JXR96_07560 [Deltaproteobacteria bacterium]|nr:hypothetical protein [Deltaproteobacteria bacterium]